MSTSIPPGGSAAPGPALPEGAADLKSLILADVQARRARDLARERIERSLAEQADAGEKLRRQEDALANTRALVVQTATAADHAERDLEDATARLTRVKAALARQVAAARSLASEAAAACEAERALAGQYTQDLARERDAREHLDALLGMARRERDALEQDMATLRQADADARAKHEELRAAARALKDELAAMPQANPGAALADLRARLAADRATVVREAEAWREQRLALAREGAAETELRARLVAAKSERDSLATDLRVVEAAATALASDLDANRNAAAALAVEINRQVTARATQTARATALGVALARLALRTDQTTTQLAARRAEHEELQARVRELRLQNANLVADSARLAATNRHEKRQAEAAARSAPPTDDASDAGLVPSAQAANESPPTDAGPSPSPRAEEWPQGPVAWPSPQPRKRARGWLLGIVFAAAAAAIYLVPRYLP
ncbi:MAG: hypothetical protein ACKVQQ_14665 [Burkholderiales bacterium]